MDVAKTTGYYRLAAALRNRFLPPETAAAVMPAVKKDFSNDSDIPSVAAGSVDILLENYRLMTALGQEFGFPCFLLFPAPARSGGQTLARIRSGGPGRRGGRPRRKLGSRVFPRAAPDLP